jgi:hypothetical protein
VDAVGGPPYGDFTDDGEVRAAARRRPHRLGFGLAGLISDLIGDVGDQLGPLRQILASNGIMERCWNAGKPWQRPWVSGCGFWEAPVQHGGHVCCGVEFATGGRYVQVEEWVLTGLGRQGEQVPAGSARTADCEVRHDLVDSGVERVNDLGSDEVLGGHQEAVGVALHRLESRAAGVLSSRSTVLAETGASSRPMICCSVSVGVRGEMVSGRITVWGSPSPTTCR